MDVNKLGAVTRTTTGFFFKLGAERKLSRANMYVHLFFGSISKMATWRPYFFFDPHDNPVWTISRKLCKIGYQLPLFTYRKSYMKFHLTLFSFALSDLERSIQVTQVFNGTISPNLFKITTELLLMMDRKSYMRFHKGPLSLTLSELERSIQASKVFNGLYPNLFKITAELLLMMDRKAYLRFHLEPLYLTLSDLERSIQVTQVFSGLYLQIYSR